jgi:hypothetical protein
MVTGNLTLHYDRMVVLLEPTVFARGLSRKKVDAVNHPDGQFAVQFEGVSLPFRVFDKIRTVTRGAIVENKRPPNNLEAPGMRSNSRPRRPPETGGRWLLHDTGVRAIRSPPPARSVLVTQ